MAFFDDPVHQQFAEWAIGFASYGGIDYGELQAIIAKVKPADDASFFEALSTFARRRIDEAERAVVKATTSPHANATFAPRCF